MKWITSDEIISSLGDRIRLALSVADERVGARLLDLSMKHARVELEEPVFGSLEPGVLLVMHLHGPELPVPLRVFARVLRVDGAGRGARASLAVLDLLCLREQMPTWLQAIMDRRESERFRPLPGSPPIPVTVTAGRGQVTEEGCLVDISLHGMAVRLPQPWLQAVQEGDSVTLSFCLPPSPERRTVPAIVRHHRPEGASAVVGIVFQPELEAQLTDLQSAIHEFLYAE